MDGRRFDDLTRVLGTPGSRRGFLKGLLGAGLAAAGLGRLAGTDVAAQVSQAQCGNTSCRNNPAKCAPGCVCCVYGNGNTRCTPPGLCAAGQIVCPPGKFADPVLGCVACLSAANCPAPTDGNPCHAAACVNGTCGHQPGNVGATCAPSTCASGAVTRYACDAVGACTASTPEPCSLYLCAGDGTGCRTSCAGDGDCVGSAFCRDGQCFGDLALGATCISNGQCLSGFCTNGICCNVAACGTCQACNSQGSCAPVAEGGLCTPEDTCSVEGRCTAGGACIAIGAPRDCESRECQAGVCCQVGLCENGACQYRSVEGDPLCGEAGECFAMVCRDGFCQRVGRNENQSCSGGTTCNPKVCRSGICQSAPELVYGLECPGGLCFDGACCQGATAEVGFCGIGLGPCCASERCCGGGCCDECFNEPSTTGGDDLQICCPAESLCPPNDPNASGCCYGSETCLQTSPNGYQCIDDDRVCGGVLCDGECCGTDCCEDGQHCTSQGCVAVPTIACTTHAECSADLLCVGITEEIDPTSGEIIVKPGFCCPGIRACPNLGYQGPGSEPEIICLSYGFRCDSTGATCDNAYYAACGNCVNCSPRGGRTRL